MTAWLIWRPTVASALLGAALILGGRVLKPAAEALPTDPLPERPAVRAWGVELNLAYLIVICAGVMVYCRWYFLTTEARILSVVTLVFVFLVWRTTAKSLSLAAGFLTLLLIPFVWTEPGYNARTDYMFFGSHYSNLLTLFFGPVFWTTLLLSLAPLLRLCQIGPLAVGRLRGDLSFRFYHVPVYIPFGSALLLTSLVELSARLFSARVFAV
jgi:hypothetical protein